MKKNFCTHHIQLSGCSSRLFSLDCLNWIRRSEVHEFSAFLQHTATATRHARHINVCKKQKKNINKKFFSISCGRFALGVSRSRRHNSSSVLFILKVLNRFYRHLWHSPVAPFCWKWRLSLDGGNFAINFQFCMISIIVFSREERDFSLKQNFAKSGRQGVGKIGENRFSDWYSKFEKPLESFF